MAAPTLIVITGPTASGKSALAVETAHRLGAEIISADSRQVYSGIPIATAMPSPEERTLVTHHLIDMLPLDAYYSASQFEEDALNIAGNLFRKSDIAVVCGGSMLYVDALCHGIDELPTVPDSIRDQLKFEHKRLGDEWLISELKTLDPDYYREVDLKNIKRVFHAIEIIRSAGKTYSELRTGQKIKRNFNIKKFCIEMPREMLFERINTRVDAMVEAGLETEAASVYDKQHLNALNTVGLKEMFAYFNGEMNRIEAIERIKKNTRVYAKKQMTWWKRDSEIIPLSSNGVSALSEELLTHLR